MRRNGGAVTQIGRGKVSTYAERVAAEVVHARKVNKPRRVSRYKSQEKLTRILEDIFNLRAETEKTFDWLISPRGGHLKIDIYFGELDLAVEYHGKQHSEFPNAFHKTAEDFRYAAMCDAWKVDQLRRRGITVVEFHHNEKLTRQSVMAKLRRLNILKAS
jgi:hypothetical protein